MVEKRIVAGPAIREAALRHIQDLDDPKWRIWRPDLFARFEQFCFAFCTVLEHETGDHVPLQLLPPQQFIIGSVLGWIIGDGDPMKRPIGSRRFRTAYVESGKGFGKTPMGAALSLYLIFADAFGEKNCEPDAEGYIIAATENQAMVAYRDMRAMIERNETLKTYFKAYGGTGGGTQARVVCEETNSFIQTLGSHAQGIGRSGYRPHVIIVDEYHEHATRDMLDMMDQGKKGRKQPLTIILTNAGIMPIGPCWEERYKAIQVASRMVEDDSMFGAVFCLDDEDNPWLDKTCWSKANPTLGTVIHEHYLIEQMEHAKGIPDRRRMVERLNFARWTGDNEDQFLPADVWRAAEEDPGPRPEAPNSITLGIDLAERDDLVAVAEVWNDTELRLRARVRYYTPFDTLMGRDERSSGHLKQWADEGYIHTHPGAVVDFDFLAEQVIEGAGPVQAIAADPYKLNELMFAMERADYLAWKKEKVDTVPGRGMAVWPHPQIYARKDGGNGLWMPGSIDLLRDLMVAKDTDRHLRVEPNPVLRWNMISAIIMKDPQGNRRFDKRRSTDTNRGKIDGLVALTMAVGLHELIESGRGDSPLARYYQAGKARITGV